MLRLGEEKAAQWLIDSYRMCADDDSVYGHFGAGHVHGLYAAAAGLADAMEVAKDWLHYTLLAVRRGVLRLSTVAQWERLLRKAAYSLQFGLTASQAKEAWDGQVAAALHTLRVTAEELYGSHREGHWLDSHLQPGEQLSYQLVEEVEAATREQKKAFSGPIAERLLAPLGGARVWQHFFERLQLDCASTPVYDVRSSIKLDAAEMWRAMERDCSAMLEQTAEDVAEFLFDCFRLGAEDADVKAGTAWRVDGDTTGTVLSFLHFLLLAVRRQELHVLGEAQWELLLLQARRFRYPLDEWDAQHRWVNLDASSSVSVVSRMRALLLKVYSERREGDPMAIDPDLVWEEIYAAVEGCQPIFSGRSAVHLLAPVGGVRVWQHLHAALLESDDNKAKFLIAQLKLGSLEPGAQLSGTPVVLWTEKRVIEWIIDSYRLGADPDDVWVGFAVISDVDVMGVVLHFLHFLLLAVRRGAIHLSEPSHWKLLLRRAEELLPLPFDESHMEAKWGSGHSSGHPSSSVSFTTADAARSVLPMMAYAARAAGEPVSLDPDLVWLEIHTTLRGKPHPFTQHNAGSLLSVVGGVGVWKRFHSKLQVGVKQQKHRSGGKQIKQETGSRRRLKAKRR